MRPTTEADLDFVLRTERDPENAQFVLQWPLAKHRNAIRDPSLAHWIIQAAPDSRAVGYVILLGVGSSDRNIQLKRIALLEKGKRFGREALRLIKQVAFERWGVHRLWLDVMQHNERAYHLYRSEGFVTEGILRECEKVGDHFVSLVVMSILESEYRPV